MKKYEGNMTKYEEIFPSPRAQGEARDFSKSQEYEEIRRNKKYEEI